MTQFPTLMQSPLSYLLLACVGAALGYYFARKRTEYEVGYRRRVEVAEHVQGAVISLEEAFEEALEYVRDPGPSRELPLKRIERDLDGLEKYLAQQEIWLDSRTSTVLQSLVAGFHHYLRELGSLPRHYGDPGFESEYARVGSELETWLRSELPRAREGLADSFRDMLGVGKRIAL